MEIFTISTMVVEISIIIHSTINRTDPDDHEYSLGGFVKKHGDTQESAKAFSEQESVEENVSDFDLDFDLDDILSTKKILDIEHDFDNYATGESVEQFFFEMLLEEKSLKKENIEGLSLTSLMNYKPPEDNYSREESLERICELLDNDDMPSTPTSVTEGLFVALQPTLVNCYIEPSMIGCHAS